ncbi:MAG: ATP synthase F1 subunit epsilon [Prevotellaceae bacterium]|jgi:F-type H+-transporting ATPase subunit epsilon|nr:ATP synthase F1 subunit epsilon [Prevotellaceae bacterium]
MRLLLLSPEKTLFNGETDSVTLPGTKGQFTVWEHHAAMISTLNPGEVHFRTAQGEQVFAIDSGFVEVRNNVVSVCVEKAEKIQ